MLQYNRYLYKSEVHSIKMPHCQVMNEYTAYYSSSNYITTKQNDRGTNGPSNRKRVKRHIWMILLMSLLFVGCVH